MDKKLTADEVWTHSQLSKLRYESVKLIDRIDEAKSKLETERYTPEGYLAPVKRASLELNYEAVKLRKGYYSCKEEGRL